LKIKKPRTEWEEIEKLRNHFNTIRDEIEKKHEEKYLN
jgi:hypothetical protein